MIPSQPPPAALKRASAEDFLVPTTWGVGIGGAAALLIVLFAPRPSTSFTNLGIALGVLAMGALLGAVAGWEVARGRPVEAQRAMLRWLAERLLKAILDFVAADPAVADLANPNAATRLRKALAVTPGSLVTFIRDNGLHPTSRREIRLALDVRLKVVPIMLVEHPEVDAGYSFLDAGVGALLTSPLDRAAVEGVIEALTARAGALKPPSPTEPSPQPQETVDA